MSNTRRDETTQQTSTSCRFFTNTVSSICFFSLAGTLSGAIGSSILKSAGHENHYIQEATQMGAAGGATLGVALGIAKTLMEECTSINYADYPSTLLGGAFVTFAASQLASGMIGYGILMSAMDVDSNFGGVVADMAVGLIFSSIVTAAIYGCIHCCCGHSGTRHSASTNEVEMDTEQHNNSNDNTDIPTTGMSPV